DKMDPAEVEKSIKNIDPLPDGKSYECMFCKRVISGKYNLKIHIRTHTGYKPLHCNICNHSWRDPSNFNKHLIRHGVRKSRYNCSICSKIFIRKGDFKKHMQAKHLDAHNDEMIARSTPKRKHHVRR
ncbi:PR domain zinc finger protein, partial [Ooceraea biroi]